MKRSIKIWKLRSHDKLSLKFVNKTSAGNSPAIADWPAGFVNNCTKQWWGWGLGGLCTWLKWNYNDIFLITIWSNFKKSAWLEKVGNWGTWFLGNLVIWREIDEFETKKYKRNVGKYCYSVGKFYHVPGKSNIFSSHEKRYARKLRTPYHTKMY